jgi:hypothetical protein
MIMAYRVIEVNEGNAVVIFFALGHVESLDYRKGKQQCHQTSRKATL